VIGWAFKEEWATKCLEFINELPTTLGQSHGIEKLTRVELNIM
jgi:hypothetical protein